MFNRRTFRWTLFAAAALALAVTAALGVHRDRTTCMGVPILTQCQQAAYTEYVYEDLSSALTFNEAAAAVDVPGSTIYIPQDVKEGAHFTDLFGRLSCARSDKKLYFLPDAYFDDLPGAVQSGHAFRLIAADGSRYMEYQVVLTPLPVIHLYPDRAGTYRGNAIIWTADDPEVNRYTTKTSRAEWHLRGESSRYELKKPWKLNLRDSRGGNRDLSLLGLGADDDWILNPLVMDDTNLREKLIANLWEQLTEATDYNEPMASCRYAEVIINGEYSGLHMLQRRVDGKYLEIGSRDILIKGREEWIDAVLHCYYEVVASPFDQETTYALLSEQWTRMGGQMISPESFIDVSLMIQFPSASDNDGCKNMYYLLRPGENGYTLYFVPWDVDMAFGMKWTDSFSYAYDQTVNALIKRQEHADMLKAWPDLEEQMARRWFDLRQTILSWDNITGEIERIRQELPQSSVARDQAKWGLRHKGADTLDSMYQFLQERLEMLDSYYAGMIR